MSQLMAFFRERLLSKLWQMKCKVVVENITKIAKFTKQRQMHSRIKQTNKKRVKMSDLTALG